MAVTPTLLGKVLMTTTESTLFTSHATNPTTILSIHMQNASATVTETVTLGMGASLAAAQTAGEMFCTLLPIPPNSSLTIRGPFTVTASTAFRWDSFTGSIVTLTVTGIVNS